MLILTEPPLIFENAVSHSINWGSHSLFIYVPGGWVVRFLSLRLIDLFANTTSSPVWMLWGTCTSLPQKKLRRECGSAGWKCLQIKMLLNCLPKRLDDLPSHQQSMRVVTFPHPNRLLILSEFLFLSMWSVKRAISLLSSFAFPPTREAECCGLWHWVISWQEGGARGGGCCRPSLVLPLTDLSSLLPLLLPQERFGKLNQTTPNSKTQIRA